MIYPCTRCDKPAVVIVYTPKGCSCSKDKYQALCPQHEIRTADTSEVFIEVVRLDG